MYDLQAFIDEALCCVQRHEIRPGAYLRWTLKDDDKGQPNPYGCADACNILYSIGAFQGIQETRQAHIDELQALQASETGFFVESTHHPIHTTAHCIAALELFDVQALHRLTGLDAWRDPQQLPQFLDQLDWDNPWPQSHQGAGIYASMVLNGEATDEWIATYFKWLYDEVCPETGYWRKGRVVMRGQTDDDRGVFPYLAGSFHYLFNMEYAHQALRYPEKMIDSGLEIWHKNYWPSLGESICFADIDWVYCLTRALRQCHHRYDECMEALHAFTKRYVSYLLNLDLKTDLRFDDLHALFGCICCLAELQQSLPGVLKTRVPLKIVLDRRPFI